MGQKEKVSCPKNLMENLQGLRDHHLETFSREYFGCTHSGISSNHLYALVANQMLWASAIIIFNLISAIKVELLSALNNDHFIIPYISLFRLTIVYLCNFLLFNLKCIIDNHKVDSCEQGWFCGGK